MSVRECGVCVCVLCVVCVCVCVCVCVYERAEIRVQDLCGVLQHMSFERV